MSQKVVCKYKGVQLALNCSKIDKNIFKIIKMLNQAALLYLPFQDTQLQNDNQQGNRQTYINTTEAIQIIWKSAFVSKQLGITQQQIDSIVNNQLIGDQSVLEEMFANFQKKVNNISKKKHRLQLQSQIASFNQIKLNIFKLKKKINHPKYKKATNTIQQNKLLSLAYINLQQKDNSILMSYLKRSILRMDIRILQNSILFIQQMQTQQCLVSLQQSYPSFTINKIQLMLIIGNQYYKRGVSRYYYSYRLAKEKNIQFSPKRFIMCHKCDYFKIVENEGEKQQSICKSTFQDINQTQTAFIYQQRFLFSNFHHISKAIGENETNLGHFKRYVHPYFQKYQHICNRYICKDCTVKIPQKDIQEPQQQHQQNTIPQIQKQKQIRQAECQFCLRLCFCIRCKALDNLNKFMAIYESMGGNSRQICEEMIFLNYKHPRIKMEHIQFDAEIHKHMENSEKSITQPKIEGKRKRGRPKKIQKQQKIQPKKKQRKPRVPKQPKPKKMEIIPFKANKKWGELDAPQQYDEQNNNENGSNNEDQQSIDSTQIFPKLQDLFSSILQQQDKCFNYQQDGNQPNQENNLKMEQQVANSHTQNSNMLKSNLSTQKLNQNVQ